MALKTFTIDFAEISIDPKVGLKNYSCLYKTGIRLKSLLLNQNIQTDIKSGRTPSRFNEEYWNGENEFLTMSDVDNLTFSINPVCTDKITDIAIKEEKTLYQAKKGSLIVSNAMTVGLSFLLDRPVYINQNVFEVNLNEKKVNKKFILWYLNLIIRPLFQTTYTSKYLSKDELGRIKIPLIPKQTQDNIVAKIEPIEKNIKALKAQITTPQEIINKVFAREFRFDLEKFEALKKEKFFEIDCIELSKHRDLKFGIGTRKANIELKTFINKHFEYINLGKIISLEYGSGLTEQQRIEGEYPVMGANGIVGYHHEFLIEGPSIIVGRKGSAGEVNYIEENNYPIDTCFYVRFIKPQNIIYFAYLLKFLQLNRLTLFKGVPGLNRYDVYDVEIPNIPRAQQQTIVDEIKTALDTQQAIKQNIETQRNKIDKIIENSIL